MRRNFLGLETSATEEGRVVAAAGDSKGVDGRDEERSFRAIAVQREKRRAWGIESERSPGKRHVSTRRNYTNYRDGSDKTTQYSLR